MASGTDRAVPPSAAARALPASTTPTIASLPSAPSGPGSPGPTRAPAATPSATSVHAGGAAVPPDDSTTVITSTPGGVDSHPAPGPPPPVRPHPDAIPDAGSAADADADAIPDTDAHADPDPPADPDALAATPTPTPTKCLVPNPLRRLPWYPARAWSASQDIQTIPCPAPRVRRIGLDPRGVPAAALARATGRRARPAESRLAASSLIYVRRRRLTMPPWHRIRAAAFQGGSSPCSSSLRW